VWFVGIVSTVAGNKGSLAAGSADGVGTLASFDHPHGIVVDSTGTNFYIADTGNVAVRVLDILTSKWGWSTMVNCKQVLTCD
jgi:DNA-binding beta-propeller fold protein YncE